MTLQLVRPISLADVRAEYGAPLGTSLGAFVRGGAWVPDSPGNSGVPTVKPIALGDLLGSAAFNQTHTMVSGVSAPFTGYNDAPAIGSLVPGTVNGQPFSKLTQNSAITQLQVLSPTPGLLQGHWTSITFQTSDPVWDGQVLLSASAGFNNVIVSNWTFVGEARVFLNGVTYNLAWV